MGNLAVDDWDAQRRQDCIDPGPERHGRPLGDEIGLAVDR